jgi:hypothetical protein
VDFIDGGAHLVHRGGGLFDFAVLLLQGAVGGFGNGIHAIGGAGQLARRAGNLLNGGSQVGLHQLQGAHQLRGFIRASAVDAAGEVALGDALGQGQRRVDRPGDAASQQHRQHDRQGQCHQHHADDHRDAAVIDRRRVGAGLGRLLRVGVAQGGEIFLIGMGVLRLLGVGEQDGGRMVRRVQPDDVVEARHVGFHQAERLVEPRDLLGPVDEVLPIDRGTLVHLLLGGGDVRQRGAMPFGVTGGEQANTLQASVQQRDLQVIADLNAGLFQKLFGVTQLVQLNVGEHAQRHQQAGDESKTQGRALCDGNGS